MTTFVLCHGAWGGGWMWRRVARILRENGHEVYTPTFTGLGERSHLSTPEIGLETHIRDIQGVIAWERLEDFVLVAHSYGGIPVTGAADREWEKIRALVYLDAFLPQNGQGLVDLVTEGRNQRMRDLVDIEGDGWRLPRPVPETLEALEGPDRDLVMEFSVPHPMQTCIDKVHLEGNIPKIPKKVYVLATLLPDTSFYAFAEWTRNQDGWETLGIPTHHFLMLSMPGETAEILMRHAG